ncbi:hypothetical protein [Sphingobium sp.]|uniref:hypothetical protein n=1 Tax=Sphingobium sp. TaxID=1912891 RepID=UPI002CAE56E3|nr:hypothetical protein [Sphingobium sp.]HUD91412.1 hypothetical protein [Sphingobium sp.]
MNHDAAALLFMGRRGDIFAVRPLPSRFVLFPRYLPAQKAGKAQYSGICSW